MATTRKFTRYEGTYTGATKPIYYLNAGASFGATVEDTFEPMINQILRRIAPEVEAILQQELLDPVVEPARKKWPVGDYDKQRTSRRGGVSKAALEGVIEFDGNNIYAVIRNNARYKGRLYAYLIFFKGTAKFVGGRVVQKGTNVWQVLVRRPFLKRARRIERSLLAAIDRAAGGR